MTATPPPRAIYTRLPGKFYGLQVNGPRPKPGDVLEVTKRSGRVTKEKVLEVLSSTSDGNRHLCTKAKLTEWKKGTKFVRYPCKRKKRQVSSDSLIKRKAYEDTRKAERRDRKSWWINESLNLLKEKHGIKS